MPVITVSVEGVVAPPIDLAPLGRDSGICPDFSGRPGNLPARSPSRNTGTWPYGANHCSSSASVAPRVRDAG
eukprot:scaffold211649_cov34-Tisochrysis_lutea.AAC.2